MPRLTRSTRTELDHRSTDDVDVTLVWVTGDGIDKTVVCVRDKLKDEYFEIATETYLAFDVFEHPFAYRDFGPVGDDTPALAA
jgi:hypothetical protein